MLSEVRSSIVDENVGEAAVCSLMQDVVNEATELMISQHLDRVAVPYTVRCVTAEMLDFIHCAFVGQDNGGVRSDGSTHGSHPSAITVDSWARGAVEVKTKKPEDVKAPVQAPAGENPNASRRLRSTTSMQNIDKTLKKYGERTGDKDHADLGMTVRTKGPAKSKKNAAGASADDSASQAGQEQNQTQMTPEEQEYANKMKAEQKKKAETRQLAEKLTKQMEELKNVKDVIVDGATGRVIAVKPFDAKQGATSRKAEPKFNVPSQHEPVVDPATEKPAKPAPKRGAAGPSGRRSKRDGSEFVQEENPYGPMVEGVQPSGGVVVKEGDSTKRGDLKVPKTKITRAEYKKMVDASNTAVEPTDDDGKPKPRPDPDNPNVTIMPGHHSQDSPSASSQPSPQSKREKELQLQREKEQQQAQMKSAAEFRTQKIAKLPTRDDEDLSPTVKAMQIKAIAKEVAEQTKKEVEARRIRTGVQMYQPVLDEDD